MTEEPIVGAVYEKTTIYHDNNMVMRKDVVDVTCIEKNTVFAKMQTDRAPNYENIEPLVFTNKPYSYWVGLDEFPVKTHNDWVQFVIYKLKTLP